jgi:hypothetical protein
MLLNNPKGYKNRRSQINSPTPLLHVFALVTVKISYHHKTKYKYTTVRTNKRLHSQRTIVDDDAALSCKLHDKTRMFRIY